MTEDELLQMALEALIQAEVMYDAEFGMARSMEQIDAAGDTPYEIKVIREALAQPVTWSDYEPDGMHHNKPPQRTWIGLTTEDKQRVLETTYSSSHLDYMDAAERILKEKNHSKN